MKYLLDTNLVSEVMKARPELSVVVWLEENEAECFLSVVTVGEIEKGISLLPAGRKRSHLKETFEEFMRDNEERVLAFDLAVARRWAALTSRARRQGRMLPVLDSMIEATALYWNLTVTTRNVSDFFEAKKFNPW